MNSKKTAPKTTKKSASVAKTAPAKKGIKAATSLKTAVIKAAKKVAPTKKAAAPGSAKAIAQEVAKKLVKGTPIKKSAPVKKTAPTPKAVAPLFSQKAKAKAQPKSKAKTAPVMESEVEVVEAPLIQVGSVEITESVKLCAEILFRLKTVKVQLIDLRGKSDIADFFLLGTCDSEAQMQAILNQLQRAFKTAHLDQNGVEYRAGVRWAVFDGIDVMVHLFEDKARDEYSLAKLWQEGVLTELQAQDFSVAQTTQVEDDEEYI